MVHKSVLLSAMILITFLATAQVLGGQTSYTPKDLTFTVFSDGFVSVDYIVDIDPTMPRVNVTLFGHMYQDLTVEDQDGLPLDYSTTIDGLAISTLGATSAIVSFTTPELTNKSAEIWAFSSSTPISSSIILPENATVVGLSAAPLALENLDGRQLLTMPAGYTEIDYMIGVEGTREGALALINDAENTVQDIRSRGVVVDDAESLLQQARKAFNSGAYSDAERLASESKTSALQADAMATAAKQAIDEASTSIAEARSEGRTNGIDDAESLLEESQSAYASGDYETAKALADQARDASVAATAPIDVYLWIGLGAAAVAASTFIILFLRKRRKPVAKETDVPGEAVDLDALIRRRPDLRPEDREALKFLFDSGGEAFATAIRERFNMPRTSAWRMIRRLQREGLVEVKNVGGQSLVRMRPRRRAGGEGR
jgi:hypothetical protein